MDKRQTVVELLFICLGLFMLLLGIVIFPLLWLRDLGRETWENR